MPNSYQVPLVLSVENNNSSKEGEEEMTEVFASVLGPRLILPADFGDPTLREVSGTRRGVVIKSSSYQGAKLGATEWARLVALWKPPVHPLPALKGATVCKSVEAPGPEFLAMQTVANSSMIRHGKSLSQFSTSRISTSGTASLAASGQSRTSVTERETTASAHVPSSSASSPLPSAVREASKVNKFFALDTSTEDVSQAQRRALEAYRAELKKRLGAAFGKLQENRQSIFTPADAANFVCKVFPSKLHERSENYDPVGAFDMGAQLISLNMQGKSTSVRSLLSFHAMRGGGHVPARDRVKRDRVRSVEHMFVTFGARAFGNHAHLGSIPPPTRQCSRRLHAVPCCSTAGYDGYMRVDAWNDARPTLLQKLSKETKRRRRWHAPLSRWERGKDWLRRSLGHELKA